MGDVETVGFTWLLRYVGDEVVCRQASVLGPQSHKDLVIQDRQLNWKEHLAVPNRILFLGHAFSCENETIDSS